MTNLVAIIRAYLKIHPEMPQYALIGVLNTLVNAGTFNLLMFTTGITRGVWVPIFSIIGFAVSVLHSFVWNKLWVFKHRAVGTGLQFVWFAVILTGTALIASGTTHLIVNVIGTPPGISPILWANVAIVLVVPIAFLLNFFGVKLLVFNKTASTENG